MMEYTWADLDEANKDFYRSRQRPEWLREAERLESAMSARWIDAENRNADAEELRICRVLWIRAYDNLLKARELWNRIKGVMVQNQTLREEMENDRRDMGSEMD